MRECNCCGEVVYSEDALCSCCQEAGCDEEGQEGCEIPMCPVCETRSTFCTDDSWHSNCDDPEACRRQAERESAWLTRNSEDL